VNSSKLKRPSPLASSASKRLLARRSFVCAFEAENSSKLTVPLWSRSRAARLAGLAGFFGLAGGAMRGGGGPQFPLLFPLLVTLIST